MNNEITNNSIANNEVEELYFTEKDINRRLAEVKEDFWYDLRRETLRAVKRLLETSMDIEVQDLIGARRWEHIPGRERQSYRNGFIIGVY